MESSPKKRRHIVGEYVTGPVLVGLAVYFITEPLLHTALAGAAGLVVVEVAAHWVVSISSAVLFFIATYLSRRMGLAFLAFGGLGAWFTHVGLMKLGCSPSYSMLGALGLSPVLGLWLIPALGLIVPLPADANGDDDSPDYSAYGIGSTLDGLGKIAGCATVLATWLITSGYAGVVLYFVVHNGMQVAAKPAVLLALIPFVVSGVLPAMTIASLARATKATPPTG